MHMLLVLHIIAALGSLGAAGAVYISPSTAKLRLTNIITAVMFLSGTVLVIQNTASLLKACVTGTVLLGVVLYATASARQKLSHNS